MEHCIQYYKLFLIGRFWSVSMILILESCTTVIPGLNVIKKTFEYTFHIDTHNYPIRMLNLFWLWLSDKMFLEYEYKAWTQKFSYRKCRSHSWILIHSVLLPFIFKTRFLNNWKLRTIKSLNSTYSLYCWLLNLLEILEPKNL